MNKYRIELLNKSHEKAQFDCGEISLNNYLKKQATQDMKRNLCAIYVLLDSKAPIILGYYSLSASSILLDNLPQEMSRKLPRYPSIPVTLLGRLAVDIKLQKKGFGEILLVDALKRAYKISNELGSMAVIVDALNDDAINFYEKFGFIRFVDRKTQLFLTMEVIKKL